MVFLSSDDSPEGRKRVEYKNAKFLALTDQIEEYIKRFYKSLTAKEKAAFREYLKSYVRLQKILGYKTKFATLRQTLDKWISKQPAHADVMQAYKSTKSFPTVDQLVSVVNRITPLK